MSLGLLTATSACFDFSVPGTTVQFDYEGDSIGDDAVRCIEDRDCGLRQICVRSVCSVGCRTAADCPSGETCGGDPAQCVNALECLNDDDCGGEAPVCNRALAICVTCQRADDCAGEDVCLVSPDCLTGQRMCERADYTCGLCTSGAQCPSGVCDPDTGRCVECVEDDQCAGALVCDRELGLCTQCVDNDDCREPLPACLRNEVGGQCVLCAMDADCPEGTCNRDTLSCQGCLSDQDCLEEGLRCNPGSGLCYDTACAFREAPELLELSVEVTLETPFLAGPVAAAPVRDSTGDGVPGVADQAQVAVPMAPPDAEADALAVWATAGDQRFWRAASALGAVRGLALGDIDGDGRTETVALRDGRLVAFNPSGSPLWTSGSRTSHLPGLFDVDNDGFAEIVAGGSLFSEVGQRIWVGQGHQGGHGGLGLPGVSFAAQLQGDDTLEVVAGGTVYSATGELLCTEGLDGYAALGDVQGDSAPEIIVVSADSTVRALAPDCTRLWGPVSPGEPGQGGGPPALADLDGDGRPEIVYVADSQTLAAFGGDGALLWTAPLNDAHLAAGVSAADLDGDGAVEVFVSDSQGLRVYRGADGFALTSAPQGASALPLAAPMILDYDADDAAEVVVAAGAGEAGDRVVVFGDVRDRWADAPNRWNQVAWFGANVQDNLRAPPFLGPWWETDNRFRAQPSEVIPQAAPNLVLRRVPGAVDAGDCPDRYTVGVSVYNRGTLSVPSGASLQALLPNDQPLLNVATQERLDLGDEEIIVLTFDNLSGPIDVQLVVARPDQDEALVPECRLDDNVLVLENIGCPSL